MLHGVKRSSDTSSITTQGYWKLVPASATSAVAQEKSPRERHEFNGFSKKTRISIMNKTLLERLALPKTPVILDIGSGDGTRNKHLWKFNYQGIDLKYETKNVAKEEAIKYLQEVTPSYADLIISEYSIQFMKKPMYATKLMRRALKKGGYLYLATFGDEETISIGFKVKSLMNMIEGMKLLYFSRINVLDPPHGNLRRAHTHDSIELLAQNR